MKQHDEQHRLRTCLWIINILQQRNGLTLKELNNLWLENDLSHGLEIIPRTFFNYRSAIQDLFGIIIECDKRSCKYYIDYNDNRTTTKWLLSSFSVSQLLQQNKDLHNRILLEDIPSGVQYLSTIIEAIRQNNRISISYQRFVEEEAHKVEIEPYCTKLFHQRWYVIGKNIEKGHLQTYSLDRITDIEILEETYTIDPNFDAESYFLHSFGIYSSDKELPQTIKIKAMDTERKFLRTLPLHHSQKETIVNNNTSIFEYQLVPTKDLVIELLSRGSNIEILEPEALRKQMLEQAKAMVNLYKK